MSNIADTFAKNNPAPAKPEPSAFAKHYQAALRAIIACDEPAANILLNNVRRDLEQTPEKEGATDRLMKEALRGGMLHKLYGDYGNKNAGPWINDVKTIATIGTHIIMLGGTTGDQAAFHEFIETAREQCPHVATANVMYPKFGQ